MTAWQSIISLQSDCQCARAERRQLPVKCPGAIVGRYEPIWPISQIVDKLLQSDPRESATQVLSRQKTSITERPVFPPLTTNADQLALPPFRDHHLSGQGSTNAD